MYSMKRAGVKMMHRMRMGSFVQGGSLRVDVDTRNASALRYQLEQNTF